MFTQVIINTIMDCEGSLLLCKDRTFFIFLDTFAVSQQISKDSPLPLNVEEVMICLRDQWGATYDMRIVTRQKALYLQVMWGCLEQQSFPLDEDSYKAHINKVIEIINRLGLSKTVREWLLNIPDRPRVGKAVNLRLNSDQCLEEFLV